MQTPHRQRHLGALKSRQKPFAGRHVLVLGAITPITANVLNCVVAEDARTHLHDDRRPWNKGIQNIAKLCTRESVSCTWGIDNFFQRHPPNATFDTLIAISHGATAQVLAHFPALAERIILPEDLARLFPTCNFARAILLHLADAWRHDNPQLDPPSTS